MPDPNRMPRYDIRNDGIGPYAVFYCEICDREYRTTPDVAATMTSNIGRDAAGGLLRRVPILGGALADNVEREDPRYATTLSQAQLDKAWAQVKARFRECPTCLRVACVSCFDVQSGYCNEDSPRKDEINEAQAEQAGAMLKGFASAFGLGGIVQSVSQAAQQAAQQASQAAASMARCSKCGAVGPVGSKFCAQCGGAMIQPAVDVCPKCGKPVGGAKFCPECGTRIERSAPAGICPSCGKPTGGAKFCPECGAKQP